MNDESLDRREYKAAILREIGMKLKDARLRRGMGQAEVAQYLGLEQQTIYTWEKGKRDPGTANLFYLAKIYRVPPGYFYEDIERNIALFGDTMAKKRTK